MATICNVKRAQTVYLRYTFLVNLVIQNAKMAKDNREFKDIFNGIFLTKSSLRDFLLFHLTSVPALSQRLETASICGTNYGDFLRQSI
ncbi:hypothetical protein KIN20_021887 [Parelaphostrongylus tenuis]|uniref:Uncharacterized protein n=1 Tax=Parelaphostrongylus tenuis TaxID=148309 RepID=A0AAD5N545_PARTN|nr:hypothetical protein KIN20_021887 [Parelaphostrongylus tenuis]